MIAASPSIVASLRGMTMRPLTAFAVLVLVTLSTAASAQDRRYMDTSVGPCEDFFRFANGGWADTVKIPPQYTSLGVGREIFDRNQDALRRVLERTARNAA